MFDLTSWINFYGKWEPPPLFVPYLGYTEHMARRYQERYLEEREVANPYQWRSVGFSNKLDI